MRVAVIGIGSIGGPIAANLVENNVDVTAVVKYEELAKILRTKGLRLQGKERIRSVPIHTVAEIKNLEGKFDIIFLAMKANTVIEASKSLIKFLKDDGVLVTLQNGIVVDDVAEIVGVKRVIGAVVFWASEMLNPGIVNRTADGFFFIGLTDAAGNSTHLKEAAKLLNYCQPAIITENIYGAMFSKLAINAAINGLSAISGLTIGKLVQDSQIRCFFMKIFTEVLSIAKILGIQPIELGAFHPQEIALIGDDSQSEMDKKHKLLQEIFGTHLNVKPSTLQSLERGQKTEISFLNGYIDKKGKELSVPTPINSKITQIVNEIESGRKKITTDNLKSLNFNI